MAYPELSLNILLIKRLFLLLLRVLDILYWYDLMHFNED